MSANETVGSPTTNTQETITDIIAAKRSEADSIEQSARGSFKVGYSWDDLPFTEGDLERALDNAAQIRKEADRLEAALKRELESMSGNAAKLREAMIEVLEYIESFHKYITPGKGKKLTALFAVADTIRGKARAALATTSIQNTQGQ